MACSHACHGPNHRYSQGPDATQSGSYRSQKFKMYFPCAPPVARLPDEPGAVPTDEDDFGDDFGPLRVAR